MGRNYQRSTMPEFRTSEFEESYDAFLEGDSEEIKGGKLLAQRIRSLDPAPARCLPSTASAKEAVDLMRKHKHGAVLIVDDGELKGIFTERDVLVKCLGETSTDLKMIPITQVMTADPETLELGNGIGYALNAMHTGGYRHIPIVDDEGGWHIVSVRDIVSWVVHLFPDAILNLPPEQGLHRPELESGG